MHSETLVVFKTKKPTPQTLVRWREVHEVVQILANKGEDSDTTAAIAGGLMGLHIGFDNLPSRYVETILEKERIEKLSEKIYELQNKKFGLFS